MNTLYLSPTCPHCKNVVLFILDNLPRENGIVFKDITTDRAAANELLSEIGDFLAPTLITDYGGQRTRIVGFPKIVEALRSQGWPR